MAGLANPQEVRNSRWIPGQVAETCRTLCKQLHSQQHILSKMPPQQGEVLANLVPSLGIGFGIVIACHYSLTYEGSRKARLFRLAAAPFGLYAFYDFCWRDYVEPDGALYPSVRFCTKLALLIAHVY